MVKEEKYVPGFDYIKFFGAIAVALSHTFFRAYFYKYIPDTLSNFTFFLIPVFYLIAGYLFSQTTDNRHNIKSYKKKYLLKYTSFYFAVLIFSLLLFFVNKWIKTGSFTLKSFLISIIKIPILNSGEGLSIAVQLWFIPPLLLGIFIYSLIQKKSYYKPIRNVIFVLSAVLIALVEFSDYINNIFPFLYNSKLAKSLFDVLIRFLFGILFVIIGAEIQKNKSLFTSCKLIKILPFLIILAVAELWVYSLNKTHVLSGTSFICFPIVYLSVIIFKPILMIKGRKIFKYHNFITYFSALEYFLHIIEYKIINRVIGNYFITFLILTALNIILSIIICKFSAKKVTANAA